MDLKRRVRDRISLVLLIIGNISTTLSGNNLVCTNDYNETFICHLEAQNCSEYNMTLRSNNWNEERKGTFTQCDVGQCCCSFEQMALILGETYTATVWKGGKSMGSKIISVKESIKPKTPTIISVKETNGNFEVKWDPNMVHWFASSLTANVTYHKKGDTKKVSVSVQPTSINKLNNYEILGRHLEPSTTYAVSVQSYTAFSDKYSDSSKELEFTTTGSPDALPLAIIIILSIAAVICTGVIYVFFVKLKTRWDAVAKCPYPKLCVIHPSDQKVLKPGTTDFSIAYVEPLVPDDSKPWSKGSLRDTSSGGLQQSSGIRIGSSCLSPEPPDIKACVDDALQKVFANIGLLSHLTTKELNKDNGLLSSPYNPCDVRDDDTSCWSSGFDNKIYSPQNLCGGRADDTICWSSDFDNKTYSIFNPSCPHQIVTDSSEVQTQAEMLYDSAYHPSAGAIVTCVDPQAPACPLFNSPPGGPSLMPTDMSYQQCNADSPFPYAEDSSLSSDSSGNNTIASCDPVSRVEAQCESSEEAVCGATKQHGETEGATIMDEKKHC